MRRVPKDSHDFIEILMRRHETGMQARPDQRPGQLKSEANRAGAMVFVAPELVLGTLQQGFEFYRSLEAPLSRAIMMMFLVTEVHPFADGNGRLARIMMNAELVAAGEDRIVIPTVFRDNYLAASRQCQTQAQPSLLSVFWTMARGGRRRSLGVGSIRRA